MFFEQDKERAVLVTGGAGFIGSHTCKALACASYFPVTYDDLSRGHMSAVKWGPLEKGSVLDRKRLDRVFETYRPSALIHFAAFAYVEESVRDPAKYFWNNVVGSLTLLEAAKDHGCERVVVSSSCATYGIRDNTPVIEDTPQRPINPYGKSKLMMEQIFAEFAVAYGLSAVCLRYFNAAGADPENEIGEKHEPETHLIPIVLDTAIGKRPHITVHGVDYETPDGTCVRDYVHVTDLATAHVKAIEIPVAIGCFEPFNLGTGKGYSVKEIIAHAKRVTKREIPIVYGERRPGDPGYLIGNADKAKRFLGWKPEFSQLETIIKTAWAWHNR